jgi:hypothetical protein
MALQMLEPGAPVFPLRVIGYAELLGITGLILHLLTGMVPVLTPLAAAGLALIMVGAFFFHLNRKEHKMLPVIALVFLLSAVVAWYRFQAI